MSITYRSLLANLQAMSSKQLDQDVTVYLRGNDEFVSLSDQEPIMVASEAVIDALDPGHIYFVI